MTEGTGDVKAPTSPRACISTYLSVIMIIPTTYTANQHQLRKRWLETCEELLPFPAHLLFLLRSSPHPTGRGTPQWPEMVTEKPSTHHSAHTAA